VRHPRTKYLCLTIVQYYSSTIHQQTGWYQITSIMLSDMGFMESGNIEQYSSTGSSHSWQDEYEHLLLELLCEAFTNKIFASDDCESRQIDLSKDDPRDQIVSVLFPCLKTILLSEFLFCSIDLLRYSSCQLWEPSISGYLVIQPEQVTHKLVGIKSCLFDSESFSESNQESGCVDQIRQHYSSTIHQQTVVRIFVLLN
jgi:hypothetical protein